MSESFCGVTLLSLQILGSIYTITRSNLIIVRIENPEKIPQIGDHVTDVNNEPVGVIVDIIGPVASPFAVLKPAKPSILSSLKPSSILFYRSRKVSRVRKARR